MTGGLWALIIFTQTEKIGGSHIGGLNDLIAHAEIMAVMNGAEIIDYILIENID